MRLEEQCSRQYCARPISRVVLVCIVHTLLQCVRRCHSSSCATGSFTKPDSSKAGGGSSSYPSGASTSRKPASQPYEAYSTYYADPAGSAAFTGAAAPSAGSAKASFWEAAGAAFGGPAQAQSSPRLQSPVSTLSFGHCLTLS